VTSWPRRIGRLAALAALSGATFVAVFELACQLYGARVLRQQRALRARPDHYFAASTNTILAYELAKSRTVEKDGRTLRLNRYGIREDSDTIPAAHTVALLGDSVVFGTGLSQDQTIGTLLQQALAAKASRGKVLNWGVPGYNLPELVEQLKVMCDVYSPGEVVYILNPNDFCRRDTIYEGADNGLYRMYRPPRLKSRWFVGKLVYRIQKEGMVSVRWYRWLYGGARDAGLEDIRRMAQYCTQRNCPFSVVLLPAGCAYSDGGYALDGMYSDMEAWLRANRIACTNAVDAFRDGPALYFTNSDHLTPQGNAVMAGVAARVLNRENLSTR
jgi:hypothetical protein